jgi:hypothetical protein
MFHDPIHRDAFIGVLCRDRGGGPRIIIVTNTQPPVETAPDSEKSWIEPILFRPT